jgi:hypothetical protein
MNDWCFDLVDYAKRTDMKNAHEKKHKHHDEINKDDPEHGKKIKSANEKKSINTQEEKSTL